MNRDNAELIAAKALNWLAGDYDRFAPFLAESGVSPAEIREAARNPEFLGFVMDYLLSADWMVIEFAESENLDPQSVARARAMLPGGDLPHWT